MWSEVSMEQTKLGGSVQRLPTLVLDVDVLLGLIISQLG
jgi:hypothetical protein